MAYLKEGIAIQGLDKAINFCRLLPNGVGEQLGQSMRAAAEPVLFAVRAAAPRSKTGHAGRLADSGRVRVALNVTHPTVSLVFGGAKAPYAGVRMFGKRAQVRAYSRKAGPVGGYFRHLTPDPFLYRVGAAHTQEVADKIISDVNRVIERLARA